MCCCIVILPYIFFKCPHFNDNKIIIEFKINSKLFEHLEFLLWEWKSRISIEWYPYLVAIKQDLLIYSDELPSQRILKTQSLPLAKKLLKK